MQLQLLKRVAFGLRMQMVNRNESKGRWVQLGHLLTKVVINLEKGKYGVEKLDTVLTESLNS